MVFLLEGRGLAAGEPVHRDGGIFAVVVPQVR
jgi:hypothetical protein